MTPQRERAASRAFAQHLPHPRPHVRPVRPRDCLPRRVAAAAPAARPRTRRRGRASPSRSEEHTSELQSLAYLVCRLLLEKKKDTKPDKLPTLRQMDTLLALQHAL